MTKFNQFEDGFSLTNNEPKISTQWENQNIYNKQQSINYSNQKFNFCDGPPFVSGNLHMGHLLVSSLKSALCNYKTMCGYDVQNKLGFDTHGLPIEQLANRELGLNTRQDVINYGIDKYNEYCKKRINDLSGSWKPLFNRIGRFVDYDNQYKTMDRDFMGSCWNVFKQLWDKGLVYRGRKVMHYSTALNTPISNHEATQNYKEVVDTSVFVKFKIKNSTNEFIIAWTTTPWTLPSNMTLCINQTYDYVKIKVNDEIYILCKSTLNNLYPSKKKSKTPYIILDTFKGTELLGLEYEPLFNNFDIEYKVIHADYVTDESGTGIVHTAPAFGEDDFNQCIDVGLVTTRNIGDYCLIDEEGKFKSDDNVDEYLRGIYFKDADKLIIKNLGDKIVKKMHYKHNYPYCWRTDTPLIYMACPSFFIDVPKIRDQLVENNKKINWLPSHVGENRFHQWLSNAKEWSISRSRFFGTPIPVFVSEDGEEMECIDNLDQDDIHPEFMKNIVIKSKTGKELRWVGEIFDCWFESGCVPIAQGLDEVDFICEGIDQTRGWFYTLNVLSTALYNKPAFKNVLCTGLILGEDGKKISKKLGNFVPPMELIEKYGADALRLYLIGCTAAKAESCKFLESEVMEMSKRLRQLQNVYKFFIEHCINNDVTIEDFTETNYDDLMDGWINDRLNGLIEEIRTNMDEYKVYKVVPLIMDFIEDLANWYIKFSRSRIKSGACLSNTYYILWKFTKVLAPFAPFLSDELYQRLCKNEESVHLCNYPIIRQINDNDIVQSMKQLQNICAMVRNMRCNTKTHTTAKVPIKLVSVYGGDIADVCGYMMEELNCMDVDYYDDFDEYVKYSIIPDNKKIGKKYRKEAKNVRKYLEELSTEDIRNYIDGIDLIYDNNIIDRDSLNVKVDVMYDLKDNEAYMYENGILVVCNMEYSQEVKDKYMKTLFIRCVQEMRKKSGLHPWDKIKIYYKGDDHVNGILNKYHDEISRWLGYDVIEMDSIINEDVIIQDTHTILDRNIEIVICKQ